MNKSIIQFLESFAFATKALRANLMRTILSLSGITVGIFLIIAVLSLVSSLESGVKASFDMLGDDVLFIQKWPMGPEEGDEEYAWWKYMSRRQPRVRDFEDLEDRLAYAEALGFQSAAIKTAKYANNYMENVAVVGVSYGYQDVIEINLEDGRFFTDEEAASGRNVAVLGATTASQLFPDGQAVGKSIKVGGLKVEVIGVILKEGNSLLKNGFDESIVVPVNYATRLYDVDEVDCSIIVKAKEGVPTEQLKDEIIANFRAIRGIKPTQGNDFSIIAATMIGEFIDGVFGIISGIGFGIGLISIFVGMFGIVNIMFVSVKERTPQIGIQKSLGAKRSFILNQFLIESMILCLIGGVVGLSLVILVLYGLSVLTEVNFFMSWTNAAIGIGMSALIGILSGILPAHRASRLNPVEAMRA
ncbi:MAG: ABC transporter permease [Flavobacteriales bacterium]|nr:ABC transporter permease [Flavobacteriales bacterium]